jgi:argininosuccinate lyase
MPNKRNPDVVELLRAAYAVVPGARSELESLLSLPSGYHRDLQGTKGPLLRAMSRGLDALALVGELVEQIEFDTERLREAINSEMYATDRAVELTAEGLPFREAYRRVAGELDDLGDRTADDSLDARTSPGACADLRLDELAERLASLD